MSDSGRPVKSINIWRSLKGLPQDIWVLALASLVNRVGTMVLPFLVLYLTRELGFSPANAGLALGVYGLGSIIVSPLAGRLCDITGPLPIMRASLIASGVLLFFFPFVRSFPGIIAITLVWAIVTECFRPATLTLVAQVATPEQRKPAYALVRLAINIGMSIGPAAAGFLAARSFHWIFIVDGVTTISAGIVLIAVPFAVTTQFASEKDANAADRSSSGTILGDHRFMFFLAAIFLMGVVFFQHEGPLSLFLVQDLNLSPAFYGMLFTINTLLIVLIEVPLNAATARWPHSRALALGAFLFAVGSGAFAFASGPELIIVGVVVWTFGEMMLFPQASAYVAEIAPPSRRGEYMGAYSLAFNFAFAVAPWAGTVAFDRYGARFLWVSVFFVGVVSAVMMTQVAGSTPKVEPTAA
ncbi:MAG: MFS transporter [Gemmatimonadales bacterium]